MPQCRVCGVPQPRRALVTTIASTGMKVVGLSRIVGACTRGFTCCGCSYCFSVLVSALRRMVLAVSRSRVKRDHLRAWTCVPLMTAEKGVVGGTRLWAMTAAGADMNT